MTYKEEDWLRILRGLQSARTKLEEYKALDAKARFPDLFDEAVTNLWTFGEYAINIRVESLGENPPQNHTQFKKAEELYQAGKLAKDYSKPLSHLEAYRKKASHLGYTKDRSTHYGPAEVLRCLEEMEDLRDEVQAAIKVWKHRQ